MSSDGNCEVIKLLLANQREDFFKRREIEWKVNLSLWAGIAIAAWYVQTMKLDKLGVALSLAAFLTVTAVYFFGWYNRIAHANAVDKLWIRYYRAQLEEKCQKNDNVKPPLSGKDIDPDVFTPWMWSVSFLKGCPPKQFGDKEDYVNEKVREFKWAKNYTLIVFCLIVGFHVLQMYKGP